MHRFLIVLLCVSLGGIVVADAPLLTASRAPGQLSAEAQRALDARVTAFLEASRGTWHDLNVPEADGRALHDLIVEHGATRALEIGTSTGHSGIWIAWALARTGGRLITVEIDETRYREAQRNFEEAGVAPFIDARLADAHELVPALDGPFDFVFVDADKDWYVNYARAVLPKLVSGGLLTAHNVSGGSGQRRGRRGSQGADYYAFVTGLPDLQTRIVNGQLAISVKRAPDGR
jgi:caffeoyl-CoA O-methyltransferase